LAVIAVSVGMIAGGAFYYDAARDRAQSGNLAEARDSLSAAIAVDPGMALYWRQRGIIEVLTNSTTAAVLDLEEATRLNPSDDVAWRALAMSYRRSDDDRRAINALERAILVQRADPASLLLRAFWLVEDGESQDATDLLAYIVRVWPAVTGAPTWGDLMERAGSDPHSVYTYAAKLWKDRTEAPSGDAILLSVLAEEPGLLPASTRGGWVQGSYDCGLLTAEAEDWDRRQAHLWAASIRADAWHGAPPPDKIRVFELMTGFAPGTPSQALDPLADTPLFGLSADLFGYRRPPIDWPGGINNLPSPDSGAYRWLFDPEAARREAGLPCP
jgi:tetratricopeptide (TPR) repeat protein